MVEISALLRVVFFALPIYVANSSAMAIKGRVPLDGGKNWSDGRRVLGDGKTWRGTISGVLMGWVATLSLASVAGSLFSNYILLGILATIGAIFGDLFASFLKRRMFMKRGQQAFLLDQLDFVIGAVAFGAITYLPNWEEFSILIIATIIMHSFANWVAYMIKMKSVPW
ncbi:MAG: CDP-2,3-bis-(O-geranylgeranyl)-sn-glycerol synthase [Candidatus Diapherotrites archaeon]|nr:CDP-2,3-bis-(O-geranylgeranyl)-sn-glycerol synthase [Candidatus Diapherotrites archaeon]